MTKEEAVSAGLEALKASVLQSASDQLGNAYEAGQANGSGGGFSQEYVDGKVAEALAAQKEKFDADFAADESADAEELRKAKDDASAAMTAMQEAQAALQAQFDALAAKESAEASDLEGAKAAISGYQNSIADVQAALDKIKALVFGE